MTISSERRMCYRYCVQVHILREIFPSDFQTFEHRLLRYGKAVKNLVAFAINFETRL
jgi:hypothetical protein